jgi:hypothetical protein
MEGGGRLPVKGIDIEVVFLDPPYERAVHDVLRVGFRDLRRLKRLLGRIGGGWQKVTVCAGGYKAHHHGEAAKRLDTLVVWQNVYYHAAKALKA